MEENKDEEDEEQCAAFDPSPCRAQWVSNQCRGEPGVHQLIWFEGRSFSAHLSSGVGIQGPLLQPLLAFCRKGLENKKDVRAAGRSEGGAESVIEGGASAHLHMCVTCWQIHFFAALGGVVNLVYGCVKYICEMICRPGSVRGVTLRQAPPSARTPPHPITL